jgi:hypothetical protein
MIAKTERTGDVMRNRWGRILATGALFVGLLSGGLAGCGTSSSQAKTTTSASATTTVVPPPAPIGIGTTLFTGMSPRTGPPGTRAVISGQDLSSVRTVCFGARAATGLRVSAGGLKLTVAVPAGSGTVEVTVIVKSGRSARLTRFSYRGAAVAGTATASPGGQCATVSP